MEPELFALAEISQAGQIVNGSGIHRSRGSHHQKRRQARRAIGLNRIFERRQIDSVAAVAGDQMQRVAAQACDVHGLGNAAMNGV